jgi:hypothetical protein
MADASRDPTPSGWGEAFAALPLESPPAARWPQIAARLDGPARPARNRRHWLAMAAGLCALAALPLAWTLRDAGKDGDVHDDTAVIAAVSAPGIDPPSPTPTGPAIETDIENPSTTPTVAIADAPTPSAADTKRVGQRKAGRERRRAANASEAGTQIAAAASNPESAAVPSGDAPERALESLYAASTQLETLLALTRDTRVESGPAAALAGALDAELATIDAQLAQPGLEALQQQALWQARVDTLRQAADFETQQRVLSAQGRSYEGALVRVD